MCCFERLCSLVPKIKGKTGAGNPQELNIHRLSCELRQPKLRAFMGKINLYIILLSISMCGIHTVSISL